MKQDLIKTKICSRCKEIKSISEFGKEGRAKDNLRSECAKCREEDSKQYYKKNKEKILKYSSEYQKQYKIDNPIRHWCSQTIRIHRHRGYKVLFTVKELFMVAEKTIHCSLCGIKFDWKYGNKKGKPTRNSPSLDRINNEKIMTLDNTQIICYKCNMAKGEMSIKKFIDYCKMVVNKYEK